MKLLTIYPIQSCNLNCYYCPSKQYVYPAESENNKINNEMIFKWVDYYLNPKEWLIEITGGGEPGMYPEIDGLIHGLEERGYYGEIKTNGTLPIPESEHFIRIAAWHSVFDSKNPPKYFDTMIIIMNPDDEWNKKVEYCETHNIPYQKFTFIPFHLPTSMRKPEQHEPVMLNRLITDWTVVYSSGRIARCFQGRNSDNVTIQKMCPPQIQPISGICPYCSNTAKFERFIPQKWIEMFAESEMYTAKNDKL